MKIGFTGMDLPEGKVKYQDDTLMALQKKDSPKKVSPFFAELIRDEFVRVDVIVVPSDKILDVLIFDMEKIEARLSRTEDQIEKVLMEKCLAMLEEEIPLCEGVFTADEAEQLKPVAPISSKPVVQIEGDMEVNTVISMALEKAGCMFFYTSGPTESHAWLVKKDSDIVSCAAKIHSDLARGFIRGDVVSFENYMQCHNFNECRSKGLARLVDRDYIVEPGDIIEIRFNV